MNSYPSFPSSKLEVVGKVLSVVLPVLGVGDLLDDLGVLTGDLREDFGVGTGSFTFPGWGLVSSTLPRVSTVFNIYSSKYQIDAFQNGKSLQHKQSAIISNTATFNSWYFHVNKSIFKTLSVLKCSLKSDYNENYTSTYDIIPVLCCGSLSQYYKPYCL